MSNDRAPVCNLPNIGQVPARQAGRMYPAVPKAQDLPSALAAINTLTQIVLDLAAPGLPALENNLATFTLTQNFVGTPGINAAAGASAKGGGFATDGDDGNKAEQPNWRPTRIETEKIKVVNPDDDDQFVIVRRIISLEFTDQTTPDSKITFKMGSQ